MIHPLMFKVFAAAALDRPLGDDRGTRDMESNARYYSRRAIEERMKAQRAITEAARTWHAKLAHDFAERAIECTAAANHSDAGPTAATA
jgi:hypothetical protein